MTEDLRAWAPHTVFRVGFDDGQRWAENVQRTGSPEAWERRWPSALSLRGWGGSRKSRVVGREEEGGAEQRAASGSTAGSGRQESGPTWMLAVSPVGACACPEVCGSWGRGRGLWSVHMASRVLLSPLQQGEYKQGPSPEDTSFTAKLNELRKAFLERPGCPQFSTKATSMSHYGESRPRGGPRVATTSLPGGAG